jgi:hypothetical protein
MRKIKNLLRDWLEISEDKFHLDAELIRMRNKIDSLESQLEDSVKNFEDKISDVEYTLEDKVSNWDVEDIVRDTAYHDIDDIKTDLEGVFDYDEVKDIVFDLVMDEIENRDTLKELVSTEVENHTHTTEEQGYPVDVDVNEIAEEVLELLIEKLKG